jgi:hypothetical protein
MSRVTFHSTAVVAPRLKNSDFEVQQMARSSCVVTKGYSRFAMIARLIAAFARSIIYSIML